MNSKQKNKGFTLLEILLVVAAIGILAGIVIVALNPGKQLGDTRNAQRQSNVNTILNAVNQYAIDESGNLPSSIDDDPDTIEMIGTASSGCDLCTSTTTESACADLAADLVPTYVADLPVDPQSGAASSTGYYVNINDDSRVVVGSCEAEQDAVIEVTR